MHYSNDDLKSDGYLNNIARRWMRRMARCLRNNKDKGPWVGKGASNYATKMQTKLSELIAAGANAENDPEACAAAAADLAVLAHMFNDVVLDETADARKAKRKAAQDESQALEQAERTKLRAAAKADSGKRREKLSADKTRKRATKKKGGA